MRVQITENYDYRWPSRAVSAFKASEEPITVKQTVGAALVAAGAAVEVDGTDAPVEETPASPSAPPASRKPKKTSVPYTKG